MRKTLTVAAASINTVPLAVKDNTALIIEAYREATARGADLVLMPELCITGYGLEDMFYVSSSMEKIPETVKALSREVLPDTYLAVGFPFLIPGGQLYNAVALLTHDRVLGIVLKQHLARTGIHYEPRWFTPWQHGAVVSMDFAGEQVSVGDLVFVIDGVRIGFEICEDSWVANRPGRSLSRRLCDVILNPSASHFAIGKRQERVTFVTDGSRAFGAVYVYANLLGCESGRAVYDGDLIVASGGRLSGLSERLSFAPWRLLTANCDLRVNRQIREQSSMLLSVQDSCGDGVLFTGLKFRPEDSSREISPEVPLVPENDLETSARVVALGLWDWMRKTRTGGFALSLSGGADSALCAAMVYFGMAQALATLGEPEFLRILASCGVRPDPRAPGETPLEYIRNAIMPKVLLTLYQGSDYSGDVTFNAAKGLASEIGSWHHSWSISALVKEYIRLADSLTPDNPLSWEKDDLALQNIQARVRSPGIWLLANRYNRLLIATSNLSEASVGYCTMDGDTSGVISPIGGIGKSRILKINRYLLEEGLPIQDCGAFGQDRLRIAAMAAIVAQAPTAELRPVEQTDEKDLMPYPLLDEIRRLFQVTHFTPAEVFTELLRSEFAKTMTPQTILDAVRRYCRLYTRNQWKRERLATGFHVEGDSADSRTYRRFPVLSSALAEELQELNDMAAGMGLS